LILLLATRIDVAIDFALVHRGELAMADPGLAADSVTGTPSLPCSRMNAFCAFENFEAFIAPRSFPAGFRPQKTIVKNGPILRAQTNQARQFDYAWRWILPGYTR